MGLERGCKSTPNSKPPQARWESRNGSLRTLCIGFIRQWTRHVPMSQMIVMSGTSWLGCHKWSVVDGLSRASCHRHTSDSDQASYSGMVARTICEDSVLNHRSKLPWMKRRSTNYQEQVAIDIIMNVPPWTARHNQVTKVDMSLQHWCNPCVDGVMKSTGRVVLLIRMLPWLVQSACKMFARSSLWAPTRTRCIDVRTVSVICEPGFLLTKTWRHDDMYASWLQRSYICRDGFV